MTTFTRKEYLSKVCTHAEYNAQFVDLAIKTRVIEAIGIKALMNSKDEHMNDIPLKKWDRLAMPAPKHISDKMRAQGDYPTLGGMVCIYKEAARQVIEETNEGLVRYETNQFITRFIDVVNREPVAWGCYNESVSGGYKTQINWEGPDRALRDFTKSLIEKGVLNQPVEN
jgi:hypothetical protein